MLILLTKLDGTEILIDTINLIFAEEVEDCTNVAIRTSDSNIHCVQVTESAQEILGLCGLS